MFRDNKQFNESNMSMTIKKSFLLISVATAIILGTVSQQLGSQNEDLQCTHNIDFPADGAKFHCDVNVSLKDIGQQEENLGMDQALLIVVGEKAKSDAKLYANWDVCWECPCINFTQVIKGTNSSCIIDTSFPLHMVLVSDRNITIGKFHKTLLQYGTYYLWIEPSEVNITHFVFVDSPADAHIPIYVAMAIFVALAIMWVIVKIVYRKGYLYRFAVCLPHERLINSDLGTPDTESIIRDEEPKTVPKKTRLKSLDTFRGLCLVIMIFVNYSGGGYWFFHHSAWDGLTVADLVFPWFTFIMGTSIALAFRSMVTKGAGKKELALKVTKRTMILFVLGLMISNTGKRGFVGLNEVRIPGVLQRLALSYFAVAMMEVFFASRTIPADRAQCWYWHIRDLVPFWPEWLISLLLLSTHLLLTFLLNDPKCPKGYLGPGGLHNYPHYVNCTGGAAGYIDRTVFGSQHIYGHPTSKIPYQSTQSFDPEGILGTLTSIFICFLGLQAGKIIVIYKGHIDRISRWIIWSLLCGIIGGSLCNFNQYDGVIPVNKNFWSVSFILALSSMAFLLLGFCYVVIDVKRYWSGAPFFYPGMNSIVVYMCHEVFHQYFPVQFKVSNTHAAQLAMHLYGTVLWTIMAAVMYYHNIFIAI